MPGPKDAGSRRLGGGVREKGVVLDAPADLLLESATRVLEECNNG